MTGDAGVFSCGAASVHKELGEGLMWLSTTMLSSSSTNSDARPGGSSTPVTGCCDSAPCLVLAAWASASSTISPAGESLGVTTATSSGSVSVLTTTLLGSGKPQQPMSASFSIFTQRIFCSSVWGSGRKRAQVLALSGCSSMRQKGSKAGSPCTSSPGFLKVMGPPPASSGRSQRTGNTSTGTAYSTLKRFPQLARRSPFRARKLTLKEPTNTTKPRKTTRWTTGPLSGYSQ
mmetsp:Transcript_86402/g.257885  ORF Transcript_86402/g.257885 Transcript_86402/m.257885 type:complete len:232 (+) Transcript_86402:260-955(+)